MSRRFANQSCSDERMTVERPRKQNRNETFAERYAIPRATEFERGNEASALSDSNLVRGGSLQANCNAHRRSLIEPFADPSSNPESGPNSPPTVNNSQASPTAGSNAAAIQEVSSL